MSLNSYAAVAGGYNYFIVSHMYLYKYEMYLDLCIDGSNGALIAHAKSPQLIWHIMQKALDLNNTHIRPEMAIDTNVIYQSVLEK